MPVCIFIIKVSGFSHLMDRWTDEWTDWVRQTGTHACQRRHAAGWRGRREGASAGGFEEQPWLLWIRISPDAGGGPTRATVVPTGQGNHKWFKISSPKRAELSKPSHLCLPQRLSVKSPLLRLDREGFAPLWIFFRGFCFCRWCLFFLAVVANAETANCSILNSAVYSKQNWTINAGAKCHNAESPIRDKTFKT